jgi:tetratricopeptide (TPR) repeat protein
MPVFNQLRNISVNCKLCPYRTFEDLSNLHNESIEYYDKVLAVEPNDFEALYNKGLALTNLGKYNESIKYYDKVLAIDPNQVLASYNKGTALLNLGKYNKSIEL